MRRTEAQAEAAALLTHFTRAAGTADALDHLTTILRTGVIRGSSRMIAGREPVVCLFDAPMPELRRILTRANRRRYQPFGIALDKRYAFRMGGRPVVYLPLAEARRMLPINELWRVAAIDLVRAVPLDWTFEREWRVRGDLPLPERGVVALVKSWPDVEEIYERFDGAPPCSGVIPLDNLFGLSS